MLYRGLTVSPWSNRRDVHEANVELTGSGLVKPQGRPGSSRTFREVTPAATVEQPWQQVQETCSVLTAARNFAGHC